MARAHSDKVRSVVTIGTPLGGGIYPKSASLGITFQKTNGKHPIVHNGANYMAELMESVGQHVPVTSIFSMGDCFVNPWTCLVPESDAVTNRVVAGNLGHYDMLYSSAVHALSVQAVLESLPDFEGSAGRSSFPQDDCDHAVMKQIADGTAPRWWNDLAL
jgi:hypothetical protein